LDISVLGWQLQKFTAAGNELLLQARAKRTDDHSSIDCKSDLRGRSFAYRSRNMFIDCVPYRDIAEKSPMLLGSEIERLHGYLVDPVIESEQDRVRSVEASRQSMGHPDPTKRWASIVGRNQFATLIEQSENIASAHLPELDPAIFNRSLIIRSHERLQARKICQQRRFACQQLPLLVLKVPVRFD
jgi:hypothetical protein